MIFFRIVILMAAMCLAFSVVGFSQSCEIADQFRKQAKGEYDEARLNQKDSKRPKAIEYLLKAVEAEKKCESPRTELIANDVKEVSVHHNRLEQFDEAISALEKGLEISGLTSFDKALLLGEMAEIYDGKKEDYPASIASYRKIVDMFAGKKDNKSLTELQWPLREIGYLNQRLGKHDEAIKAFTHLAEVQKKRRAQAISANEKESEIWGLFYYPTFMLAEAYEKSGQTQIAVAIYKQILQKARETGKKSRKREVLGKLEDLLSPYEYREFEKEELEASKTEYYGGEDHHSIAYNEKKYAVSLMSQKRYSEAITHLEKALASGKQTSNTADTIEILEKLGECQARVNQLQPALQSFQQALQLASSSNNMLAMASTSHKSGKLYHMMKQYQLAQTYYNAAIGTYAADPANKQPLSEVYMDSGLLFLEAGQRQQADQLFAESLKLKKSTAPGLYYCKALIRLGTSFELVGDKATSEKYLTEALEVAQKEGASKYVSHIEKILVRVRGQ